MHTPWTEKISFRIWHFSQKGVRDGLSGKAGRIDIPKIELRIELNKEKTYPKDAVYLTYIKKDNLLGKREKGTSEWEIMDISKGISNSKIVGLLLEGSPVVVNDYVANQQITTRLTPFLLAGKLYLYNDEWACPMSRKTQRQGVKSFYSLGLYLEPSGFLMKGAVFLDRDGTINKDCPYCKSADEIVIYDDVFKPIRNLSKRYYIIIVTNQSGISRGHFSKKTLEEINKKIKTEIKKHGGRIDAIYYCPHLPDAGCDCRKPKTGMIDSACSDFRIDLSKSFMVGDSDVDIGLGRRAGITSIRVRKGETRKRISTRRISMACSR